VKGSKGFSLLELLVVIAILGIIAAIALPRYFEAVDDAKKNAHRANIAIIQTSLEYYRNKTGSYPADAAAFNAFLQDTTYFAERPRCPYNDKYYTVDNNITPDENNPHILNYTKTGNSYSLDYYKP